VAKIRDINMHYVTAGEGVPLLLVHGWPDLWYGWRKVIKPLAEAGYRVIVPDMRGFGQTDTPKDLKGYSLKSLSTDLVALLDHCSIPRVILIGHDHGGSIVWRMTLHYPSRIVAVASICTPYIPPHKQYIPIEEIAKRWPSFQYQVYFNTDKPITEFESNIPKFFRYFLRGTGDNTGAKFTLAQITGPLMPEKDTSHPKMLTKEEFDYYVENYKRSGYAASLNYYRTHKLNYEEEKEVSATIRHPSLMITTGKDAVLTPEMTKRMEEWLPNLSRGHIADGNHWVIQQFPEEVLAILLPWLKSVRTNTSKL